MQCDVAYTYSYGTKQHLEFTYITNNTVRQNSSFHEGFLLLLFIIIILIHYYCLCNMFSPHIIQLTARCKQTDNEENWT